MRKINLFLVRRILLVSLCFVFMSAGGFLHAQETKVNRATEDPTAKEADKKTEGSSTTTEPETVIAPTVNGSTANGSTANGSTAGATKEDTQPVVAPTTGALPPSANIPANLRLKQLEQRVQSLKERAWRAKARVGMLKEAVLGGGVGARASIVHENKMGNSFRLIKLVYALDGAQIFQRSDKNGELYKEKTFEVMNGAISPGSHTVSVLAIYQGHGYGVLNYLKKYKYTVRSSHTFSANEGQGTALRATAFEKGGITAQLKDRPALDFKVSYPGKKE